VKEQISKQLMQGTGSNKQSLQFEFDCISTILNSLDALVYVSDMDTHDLIFVNDYGEKTWGLPLGRKCYQYFQSGQESTCNVCNDPKLLDHDGNPTGVHIWEFQHAATLRWYQCRDQAVKWVDGRYVRLEIAIDITESKLSHQKLETTCQEAEKVARLDPLTKAFNRRALYEYMSKRLAQSNNNQMLSIVMIDVDHFKNVNDQFGHAKGDEALISITQSILTEIRESDKLFRIGGEEFIITLPECDEAHAFNLVERIRINIEQIHLKHKKQRIKLTCSFGITDYWSASTTESLDYWSASVTEALMAEADKALYSAKLNGRNQVKLYSQISNTV
jgi:diguanylate cyclase (GGDEF)-like protein